MDCLHTPGLNQVCGQGLSCAAHSSHGCTAVFSWPWNSRPSSLSHGTLLFAILHLVLMGGEGSALLLKLRGFVALPAPAGGFEQEPHCTQEKWAGYCPTVEDAIPCHLSRGSGRDAYCVSYLFSIVLANLIANKTGKYFFSAVTRSSFSTSEELEEWIWI